MDARRGWRGVRLLLLAAAAVGLVALLAARRPERAPGVATAGPSAVAVQTAAVTRGPLRSVITAAAAIEASQQVTVAPRVSGPLAAVHVDVGAAVRAGDALATLDAGTLPAQVQQARAGVQSAEARLRVVEEGATAADLATASAALLTAVNQQSAAQTALDAVQARADAAAQALHTQQQVDRLRAQRAAAQAAIDAAIERIAGTERFRANATRAAVAALDGAVSERCTQPGNRERCATLAMGGTALDGLVTAIDSGTPAVPTDLTPLLGQFEAATQGIEAPTLRDDVFRLVQAGAALPGLSARANNLALSLGGAAGVPTAEALASALRARDAADAAAAAARARLETLQRGPTTADLLTARAALAQAQAGLAVAQASLEQTVVRAPFDGVVAERLLDAGAAASPLTPVFTLVTRAVELHLAVDEARVAQVRPGQAAELTVAAYPGRTFAGTVAVVAPLGDARAHTFDVRVLADDAGALLRPGMFAQVRVVTSEQADALLVPSAAIVAQAQGPVVFVVADGHARLRHVRTGGTDGRVTAIVEGVSAGEQVVVGQGALRDGQAVSVRAAAPTATPAR